MLYLEPHKHLTNSRMNRSLSRTLLAQIPEAIAYRIPPLLTTCAHCA